MYESISLALLIRRSPCALVIIIVVVVVIVIVIIDVVIVIDIVQSMMACSGSSNLIGYR